MTAPPAEVGKNSMGHLPSSFSHPAEETVSKKECTAARQAEGRLLRRLRGPHEHFRPIPMGRDRHFARGQGKIVWQTVSTSLLKRERCGHSTTVNEAWRSLLPCVSRRRKRGFPAIPAVYGRRYAAPAWRSRKGRAGRAPSRLARHCRLCRNPQTCFEGPFWEVLRTTGPMAKVKALARLPV